MIKLLFDTLKNRNVIGEAVSEIVNNSVDCARIISPYFSGTKKYIDFSKINKVEIICDLRNSSCNPYTMKEISQLPNVDVRFRNDVHAKVYIFDNKIIIGSANPTPNGLGVGTLEAAVLIDFDYYSDNSYSSWFGELWNDAETYSTEYLDELDWDLLKESWDSRPSRDLTGIVSHEDKSINDGACRKLSSTWEAGENILKNYMFAFYFSTRKGIADEEEIKQKHQLSFFEEGDHDNEEDALEECQKITQRLGVQPGERIVFCIEMAGVKKPKGSKFKIGGTFVAIFKYVIVHKNKQGGFEVLSMYEEVKSPSIIIDVDFINYLSSSYMDELGHPYFKNFIDQNLGEMNYFCSYSELKKAIE